MEVLNNYVFLHRFLPGLGDMAPGCFGIDNVELRYYYCVLIPCKWLECLQKYKC